MGAANGYDDQLGPNPHHNGTARQQPFCCARFSPAARKLLLVDDHELVRFGIRALHPEIGGVPIRRVEAGSLRETLELNGRAGGVDAVLLDCKGLLGLLQFLHI